MANQGLYFEYQGASINNVTIPNEKLDQIERHLFDNSIPILSQVKIQDLKGIQREAKIYLDFLQKGFLQLQEIFKKEQFSKSIYYDILAARVKSAINFAKFQIQYKMSLQKLKEYMNEIAICTEVFSARCQEQLGYETSVLYIPDADQPFIYQVKSLEDILENGHLTRARIGKSESQMQKLANDTNRQVEKISTQRMLGIDQANYLQTTYSQIIRRYNTYRYKSGNGTISIIMWNMKAGTPSDKWLAMKLSNKGDLAQTYANIVFQRKSIFSGIISPQRDINVFMWRVTQVDSVSGFLEGDFIVGNKSYSVKSGLAGTQGIVVAMEIAKEILNMSPSEIKSLLQRKKYELAYNKEGARKGLRNFVKNATGRKLQDIYGNVSRV